MPLGAAAAAAGPAADELELLLELEDPPSYPNPNEAPMFAKLACPLPCAATPAAYAEADAEDEADEDPYANQRSLFWRPNGTFLRSSRSSFE